MTPEGVLNCAPFNAGFLWGAPDFPTSSFYLREKEHSPVKAETKDKSTTGAKINLNFFGYPN